MSNYETLYNIALNELSEQDNRFKKLQRKYLSLQKTLQNLEKNAENLQRELDCALGILSENPPCKRYGFMDNHTDYCSLNCGVDKEIFKKCWLMYIDEILERTDK